MWKQSYIWQHRREFFKDGEYVLADKGKFTLFYFEKF